MRLRVLADQSMLWPEDRPVSRPRWQGDGKDLLTCDGSGLSSSALCETFAPAGSWQRTLSESLLSSLKDSTGCAVSLRLRATKSGRSLLVPTTLERRTGESGCGSWPTATALAYGNCRGGAAGRVGPVRPSLEGMARLWPTADTINRKSGRAMTASTDNGRRSGGGQSSPPGLEQACELAAGIVPRELPSLDSLPPSTRALWPTATRQDAAQSGAASYSTESGRHSGTTLTDAAAGLGASPLARDWRGDGNAPSQHERHSPNIHAQVVAAMFPTPKAADGRPKGTGGTADHGLDAMARAGLLAQGSHSTPGKSRDSWATPQVADVNYSRGSESYKRRQWEKSPYPNLALQTAGRGVLNSRWVAQLMGYASDWCELPSDVLDALTAKPSKRTATRSSRRQQP
jgi:hypothetical protein